MNQPLAPIVIFAYHRPQHLKATLESLVRCEGFTQSPLIVYCDGPRHTDELANVQATRDMARKILGERAQYHFSENNRGLSSSVIAGVTQVIAQYGKAIVVEDDLVFSPHFLTYMNQALNRYEDDHQVFQVSGFLPKVPALSDLTSAFFMPFTTSWGWATWRRAWQQFDPQATGWQQLKLNRAMRQQFNLDGNYDYATMLVKQMRGQLDSWAIRWYWSVFIAQGLTLFPPTSLVRNTGFDGSGTHGSALLRRVTGGQNILPSEQFSMPKYIELSSHYSAVKCAIWRQNGGWLGYVADRIRGIIR